MSAWSGDSGVRLAKSALFALMVFVACGGESETNQSGGGNGDDDAGNSGSSRGGSNNRGGASGDGAGGIAGASGVGMSGSSTGGTLEPRGGSGPVDPIPPPGPSFCGGEPCDPPLACCMTTGECFDPQADAEACETPDPDGDPQGRKACASSAQCGPQEFCMLDGLICLGSGHCQPIDNCGSCDGGDINAPDNPCRLCGCDGNTYPNPQTACRAGVNAVHTGAGCGETAMEGGAGSSSIPMRPYVPCGTDSQCSSGNFCCTIAARCYPEENRDICVPPPPGARIACNTNLDCGDFEYCRAEGCEGPGGCVNRGSGPGDCGILFEPVCGCDGKTYTSAACADQEGVRMDHTGECADK
jgi:hypothetical protein